MSTLIRDLIQLEGINNKFPKDPKAFTEILVEDIITIPEQKPDIEQIIQVIVSVDVKNKRLIKTPVGKSCSGEIMTGNKIVLEGIIHQKIIYVADKPSQSVHAAKFHKQFCAFIITPKIKQSMFDENCDNIMVEPYVEDIYVKQLDKRTIEKCITLFLNASSNLFNKCEHSKPHPPHFPELPANMCDDEEILEKAF